MKLLYTLLAALFFAAAAPAAAQTVKALSYNTTNGQVVAATNVTFTNTVFFGQDFSIDSSGQFAYGGNVLFETETQTWFQPFNFESAADAAASRTNLGLKAFSNEDGWAEVKDGNGNTIISLEDGVLLDREIIFSTAGYSGATRTNLGLGLPALTNTSNVTMMRALAGVTNGPVSQPITLSDGGTSWTLFFSNGILVNIAEQ